MKFQIPYYKETLGFNFAFEDEAKKFYNMVTKCVGPGNEQKTSPQKFKKSSTFF